MAASLQTSPIEDLSFEDVVAFCAEQRPESIRLEYKKEWSSKKPGPQIAKEVCAFANTRGGHILLGVDETADRLPNHEPIGQRLGSDPRKQIINACSSHIYPPLTPDVSDFLPNPGDADRGFVVIRVDPSRDVPHAINDGRDIYVRVHDHSEPARATVDQIDRMLEQRRTLVSLQESRVQQGLDRLTRVLGNVASLSVAAGPAFAPAPLLEPRAMFQSSQLKMYETKHTVTDGIYWVANPPYTAWHADIYGNFIYTEALSTMHEQVKVPDYAMNDGRLGPFHSQALSDDNHNLLVIKAARLLQPLVRTLDTCERLYRAHGLQELLCLRMLATGVNGMPLNVGSEIGWIEFGFFYNTVDSKIDIMLDSRLTAGCPGLALAAAERLLWSWGCHHEGSGKSLVKRLLECAERAEHHEDRCSKDNNP